MLFGSPFVNSRFPHIDYALRLDELRTFHAMVASIPFVTYRRLSPTSTLLSDSLLIMLFKAGTIASSAPITTVRADGSIGYYSEVYHQFLPNPKHNPTIQ